MTTNPHDDTEHNRLVRFDCGIQTAHHQLNRTLELAQDSQWLLAMEFLIVCSRTIDSLKRVVREVPSANREKRS
ncbi:hypothetical protein NDG61_005100 [Salmonella enterica]|nr:hypothetical protein [Salmonella enterica]